MPGPHRVSFTQVEVIELPMVAGENHPSIFLTSDDSDAESTDARAMDSAAITLDWKAQARTKMDVDTYEEKQKKMRVGKKLKRMSRAVRKRILRNIGVDTSDIESEDERRSKKRDKKKKKKKKKKRKFRNPFSTHEDRFSSGTSSSAEMGINPPSSDHAPTLPRRGDNMLRVPPRPSSDDGMGADLDDPNYDDHSNRSPEPTDYGTPMTPPTPRRNSLGHAIGVLAKQPGKLAKQPVRLAKYTSKKVRKSVGLSSKSKSGSNHGAQSDEAESDGDYDRKMPASPMYGISSPEPSSRDPHTNLSSDDEMYIQHYPDTTPFPPKRPPLHPHACHPLPSYANSHPKQDLPPPRPRRSSLSHVTSAIGVLAKQPVKLAKQPVRLAKYTSKKVRKRVRRSRRGSNGEMSDEGEPSGEFPSNESYMRQSRHSDALSSDIVSSEDDLSLSLEQDEQDEPDSPVRRKGTAHPRRTLEDDLEDDLQSPRPVSPMDQDEPDSPVRRNGTTHPRKPLPDIFESPTPLSPNTEEGLYLDYVITDNRLGTPSPPRPKHTFDAADDSDISYEDLPPHPNQIKRDYEGSTRQRFNHSPTSRTGNRVLEGSQRRSAYPRFQDPIPPSPRNDKLMVRPRRSSLSHVTSAIGSIAKYTTKKVKKQVGKARSRWNDSESSTHDRSSRHGRTSLPTPPPPAPPIYYPPSDDQANAYTGGNDSIDSMGEWNISISSLETPGMVPVEPLPPNIPSSEVVNDAHDEGSISIISEPLANGNSPSSSKRRTSLQHVTNAIGTVAKQPYKLAKYTAKQPMKLAKYTGRSLRKKLTSGSRSDASDSPSSHNRNEDDHYDLEEHESQQQYRQAKQARPNWMLSPIQDGSEPSSSQDLSASMDRYLSSMEKFANSMEGSGLGLDEIDLVNDPSEQFDDKTMELTKIADTTGDEPDRSDKNEVADAANVDAVAGVKVMEITGDNFDMEDVSDTPHGDGGAVVEVIRAAEDDGSDKEGVSDALHGNNMAAAVASVATDGGDSDIQDVPDGVHDNEAGMAEPRDEGEHDELVFADTTVATECVGADVEGVPDGVHEDEAVMAEPRDEGEHNGLTVADIVAATEGVGADVDCVPDGVHDDDEAVMAEPSDMVEAVGSETDNVAPSDDNRKFNYSSRAIRRHSSRVSMTGEIMDSEHDRDALEKLMANIEEDDLEFLNMDDASSNGESNARPPIMIATGEVGG